MLWGHRRDTGESAQCRIWVSPGNWRTNDLCSPLPPRPAGLVRGNPMPQMDWQLQDLGPARMDNDPLSAASLPPLSPGSGEDSSALALVMGGSVLPYLSRRDRTGIGPESLPEREDPRTCTPGSFLEKHRAPTLLLSVYLEESPTHLRLTALGSADHSMLVELSLTLSFHDMGCNMHHRPHCARCLTYVMSIVPPRDL